MPPTLKFPGLRQLIKDAGAALTREGTESAASKTIAKSMGTVPGNWQKNIYNTKGFVEELPIEFLEQISGNVTGKTSIPDLKASIQKQGLDEPLILSFDPETKRIKLGEGNHRLKALKQLGYTRVPVRAVRSYVEDSKFPQVSFKPSTDPILKDYYPADMKPSDIIDFNQLSDIAKKTSTPDEKAYLDMVRQQMAEQEAFKAEFNVPVAHGTSVQKTGGVPIEEFNPSTGWNAAYGEGVYTATQTPEGAIIGDYTTGKGPYAVPLRIRGNKVFNYSNTFSDRHPELAHLIPSRQKSVSKLSKLSGISEDELMRMITEENRVIPISDLVKKYPEEFESMYFDKIFKTFEPENLRLPWANFDPMMKKSKNTLSSLAGATLLGGSALSSNEAEASPTSKAVSKLANLTKHSSKAVANAAEKAAAREAFKAQFEPGWYHGTLRDFKSFSPRKGRYGVKAAFFTKNPDFADSVIDYGHYPQGARIVPVNLKLNNIFDYENPEHLAKLDKHFEGYLTRSGKPYIPSQKIKDGHWTEMEGPSIQEGIQELGFDGFYVFEDGEKNVGMYKKNNMRMPWANYNPEKEKSGDLMAGLAGATGLGATALGASEAKADTMDEQAAPEELEYPRDPRAQPNIDPQALKQSLTDFLGNFAVVAPKGQQEGVEPSELSPVDFITPGMVTGLGKGAASLGSKALRSDVLRKMMGKPRLVSPTEILPATKEGVTISGALKELLNKKSTDKEEI
jgi:hypothetical protein